MSLAALLNILSAFGLSTAAGLNAYIPLLLVGLLARYTDLVQLSAPYDILENPWVLLVLAVLVLLDFIGDKIPAVDHVLHMIGMIIHPIAGAILFLAANSATGTVDPVLAAIAGILMAGATHTARTAVRPASTATTGGSANPFISLAEDIGSFLLSVLAILAPIVAGLVVLGLIAAMIVGIRRLLRWRRERAAAKAG